MTELDIRVTMPEVDFSDISEELSKRLLEMIELHIIGPTDIEYLIPPEEKTKPKETSWENWYDR